MYKFKAALIYKSLHEVLKLCSLFWYIASIVHGLYLGNTACIQPNKEG